MKKEFEYLGLPVTYILNYGVRYEDVLTEHNITYQIVPIFIKGLRVLKYDGKFAIVKTKDIPEHEFEAIYVFKTMPEDYNILGLIDDIDSQARGGEPRQKKSIFRTIYSIVSAPAERSFAQRKMKDDDILLGYLTDELNGNMDDQYWIDVTFGFQNYGYPLNRIKDLPMEEDDKELYDELMTKAQEALDRRMKSYVNMLNS